MLEIEKDPEAETMELVHLTHKDGKYVLAELWLSEEDWLNIGNVMGWKQTS